MTLKIAIINLKFCFSYQAISLLTKSPDSLPHIFFITDGSFEEERNICSIMKNHVANHQPMQPRISTFGIGNYFTDANFPSS